VNERWGTWMILVLLPVLGCRRGAGDSEAAEVKPLVTVEVTRATVTEIDDAIRAPATIFPRERVSISSNLTTPIRALYARKGDKVAKDQLLARLEDRDLAAQKGEAVAAVRQAEVLRARRAELFAAGAIPQRELLATETDLLQSRARLERIEATLRFTELRSPFAGVIVDQLLYAGDVIRPDTPVFTVVDVHVVIARAQVPEADIATVHVGQTARFHNDDDPGAALAGRIAMVNQAVDPARRTVEVWCEIDNRAGHLRDGSFGQLEIVTEARRKRVVIPRAAVQFEGKADHGTVLVVDGAKDQLVAHHRAVEAVSTGDPATVAVLQGLAAGDVVVVGGGFGLPDGTRVQTATPAKAE
jgi:RND family efflux transporter MFP subunit